MEFRHIHGMATEQELVGILALHEDIFGSSDDLVGRMREKPELMIELAMDAGQIIGYKIGYALNREQFYSWLGGVNTTYRNRGIALELMKSQHHHAKEKGYQVIQTKTKNKFRNMLLLNIKFGFDIIGTYTDGEGEPKIILEKPLNE